LESSKQLINDWSFQIERLIHGTPSGIDNSCSTFGGSLTFKNKNISFLSSIPSLTILIIDTKVKRNTKHLVQKVKDNMEKKEKEMKMHLDSIEQCSLKCLDLFEKEKNMDVLNGELEVCVWSLF
jgi:mevalonate kinase